MVARMCLSIRKQIAKVDSFFDDPIDAELISLSADFPEKNLNAPDINYLVKNRVNYLV